MTKSIPEGWHSVTPRLVVHDPAALVQFVKDGFGASGDFATEAPSQIRIGDSIIMSGAVSLEEPRDVPYGDRRAVLKDPVR